MKTVWLLQLGTPEALNVKAVASYLREFLMDRRVIDIPWISRWMLVNLIIAPFRSPKTLEAYRSIWTDEGSPLLCHTRQLSFELEEALGSEYRVAFSMRYGKPSMKAAFDQFLKDGVTRILAVPLYPQYAEASFGTAVEKVFELSRNSSSIPAFQFMPPFYREDFFIDSVAAVARAHHIETFDHVLFSYHGLPESQVSRTGQDCRFNSSCCDVMRKENQYCYRAQSFETSRRLATKLNLPSDRWSVAFQSRLGKRPWIKPYTDLVVEDFARKGVKRLAVLCPSFVSDCLETLEEIGGRARESFLKHGGKELTLIPCVNSHPQWVQNLSNHIRQHFV